MKKGILAIISGVIVLAACTKSENTASTGSVGTVNESVTAPSTEGDLRLAYINMDSLEVKFTHYKKQKDQLEAEYKAGEQSVMQMQKGFEESVALFESQAPGMTNEQRATYEQDLMNTRQRVLMQQQQIEQDIMAKNQMMLENLMEDLDSVLVVVKGEHNFDFIFSYPGTGLIDANEEHDITDIIVGKLNALHQEETTE